jgi:thermitase
MLISRINAATLFTLFAIGALLAPASSGAGSRADGKISISLHNGRFNLDADNARANDVLAQLAARTQMEIKTGSVMPVRITMSTRNLQLESLLKKICPSFMLIEGAGENGAISRKIYLFNKASSGAANPRNAIMTDAASRTSGDESGLVQKDSSSMQHQKASIGSAEPRPAEFRPDELLVRFRPDLDPEQIEAFNGLYGAAVVRTISQLNVYQLKLPEGSNLAAVQKAYRESPLVEKTETNILLRLPEVTPNDAGFGDQWGLEKMMVPEAWNLTTGSPSAVVAVLDTGVDTHHPDLIHRIVDGYDVVHRQTGNPEDDHGHGTQMAGIIAGEGQNGIGISGVNWNGRVMPVKVLDASGAGSAADVAEGLIYAAEHGAWVINMSFGSYSYSELLNDAIQYAHQRNVVLVAGAGNDNTDVPAYPAAYENVLAVTATGPEDQKWPQANFGNHVALAAPGIGILTTGNDGGYLYGTGTSHAAAMVSGVAALLRAKDAGYSNVQIEKLLQASADDLGVKGRDSTFGSGRANAYRALNSSP